MDDPVEFLKGVEHEKINDSYFDTEGVREIMGKVPYTPEHAGLFLGREKKGRFIPGFPLLEMMDQDIVIKDKGIWMFLCGREVHRKNILSKSSNEGLVANERGEILGIGKIKKGSLSPSFDRGDFLRRETP
ncbi:MAG: hypothetical protein ACQEP1_02765 [Nanobdellota archaeon]